MILPTGQIRRSSINNPELAFEVEGMVNLTIYNSGQTILLVNQQEIYPGEYWTAGEGIVLKGTIEVNFQPRNNPDPNDRNKAVANFIKLVGVYDVEKETKC
ncbi:MAG: hypothetical protein AAGF96_18870 [Bacteroidota bacterium]